MTTASDLSEGQKKRIFWASFLALAAAGFGFAYRVMVLGSWGAEFELSGQQLGQIFGASLWPIAITMILFSLVIDTIGSKNTMYAAFALQALSIVLTFSAGSYNALWWAAFCAGLGHGVVEAVINPVCATIYPRRKTTMLTILHAAWPAGLVGGGALVLLFGESLSWKVNSLWMAIPVLVYGIMTIGCKFPIDERVHAKVPYKDMLKEVGFLGALIASTLLFYEIYRVASGTEPANLIWWSLGAGILIAGAFGAYTKTVGKPLFFILCMLMIPLATTELGTDAWIKELMTPVMGKYAGWAIVFSAFIMMVLRFVAGPLNARCSPPTVLVISSFFSMCGLLMLSGVSGGLIILAFILYAVGQTFYWPTVLGFVSERYPRGGALTLNTVSAIGLLSVGIIGTPIMGVFVDNSMSRETAKISTELQEKLQVERSFFGVKYSGVDRNDVLAYAKEIGTPPAEGVPPAPVVVGSVPVTPPVLEEAVNKAGRGALRTTALAFPLTMGICFALIAIWFRQQGGYKQIHLDDARAQVSGGSEF